MTRTTKEEHVQARVVWTKEPSVVDGEIYYSLEREVYLGENYIGRSLVMANCPESEVDHYMERGEDPCRNEPPRLFDVGDVVRLNSGGPDMKILAIGDEVECGWSDGSQASFAPAMLYKIAASGENIQTRNYPG